MPLTYSVSLQAYSYSAVALGLQISFEEYLHFSVLRLQLDSVYCSRLKTELRTAE